MAEKVARPRCKRCNSMSLRYTETRVTTGEGCGLDVEQTVFCVCGWSVSRFVRKPLEFSARGFEDFSERDKDGTIPANFLKGKKCCIVGCEGRVNETHNKSGLCSVCSKKDYNWRNGEDGKPRKSPPPFIPCPDNPDQLMKNPEHGRKALYGKHSRKHKPVLKAFRGEKPANRSK